MVRSGLRHDEDGVWYRLYGATDVPAPAVEAMADAALRGWEAHALPRFPHDRPPRTEQEQAAAPRNIMLFPPALVGRVEEVMGAGLTNEGLHQLGVVISVDPTDREAPTGDSWICLRNRAEADKLMQRAVEAVNRKRPGAGNLVTPPKEHRGGGA